MDYYSLAKHYHYKRLYEKAFNIFVDGAKSGDVFCSFEVANCYLNGLGVKPNRDYANNLIVTVINELEKMTNQDGKAEYFLSLIHGLSFLMSSKTKEKSYLKEAKRLGYKDALVLEVNNISDLSLYAEEGNHYALSKLMSFYSHMKSQEDSFEKYGLIALENNYIDLSFKLLNFYRLNNMVDKYEKLLNQISDMLDIHEEAKHCYKNDNGELIRGAFFSRISSSLILPSEIDGETIYSTDADLFASQDVYKIVVPNNYKVLNSFFLNRSNIIECELSENLLRIEDFAFAECINLHQINFPDSLEHISFNAFINSSLRNVILPKNLSYLGAEAFKNNKELEYVSINSKLAFLGEKVFENDKKLLRVDFEDDCILEVIPSYAFSCCFSLKDIKLPNGIKRIESEAFTSCYEIKEIVIPESVEFIAPDAFKDCRLETIYAYQNNYDYIKSHFSYDKSIVVAKLKDNTKSFEENIEMATSFDLDLNWENAFAHDEEANSIFAENVSDGLIASLSNLGRVDIEYISQVSNVPLKDVIEKLGSSIYQDPLCWDECFYKGFKTSDEYLSGNLLSKLVIAERYNKIYHGHFQKNVDALKAILPDSIKLDKIYFTIASNFIPSSLIKDFLLTIDGNKFQDKIELTKNDITGKYEIEITGSAFGFYISDFARAYSTSRINAKSLLEHALNSSPVVIYDYFVERGNKRSRILNKSETIYAEQKVKQLNEDFIAWVNEDDSRKSLVENAYNEKYGYTISRNYDGSFLNFIGINESINLFDYQKNAVARIIFNRNTLLAHNVGTGKTYIMIASGEELIRMKKSKKNMYVVPNHILDQWYEAYLKLYPYSRVKKVGPNNFNPSNMYETLLDIKNGEYNAIIIAYSCFDRIEVSKQRKIDKLIDELAEINDYMKKHKNNTSLKPAKARLEKEIEKLNDASSMFLGFDELGITRLYVDEAHNYKNIEIETSLEHIKGISLSCSKKCKNMMEKVEYMNALNGGGVIMATGTPITNSVTDAYTFQLYLQKGELELLSIKSFDNWVSMFAERHEEFEVDVDAVGFRVTSRLSRFHNLPELTVLLSSVADFHQGKDESLPDFNGYKEIVLEQTTALKDYLEELSNRADLIRSKQVKRKDDNLLMITNDGRKAALDIRLVKEDNAFNDNCKAYECAKNAYYIYESTRKEKSTQIIFCDISTPKDGFNIYDEIKSHLLLFGVLDDEIAYIHDYESDSAKRKLFKAVNNGDIRILLGSTFKLGTGVNVQQKLIAIHHVDVPWRPADMIQREGRIIRPGNENKEVYIYRYISKGSFDAYSWQLLETKQAFISELLSNSLSLRSREDISNTVLDYAEVKALAVSNPKIKERFEVANEINRLKMLDKKQQEIKVRNQIALIELPEKINELKESVLLFERDEMVYLQEKVELSVEEKNEFRNKLFEELSNNELAKEEKEFGLYQGFRIILPMNMLLDNRFIYLERNTRHKILLSNSVVGSLLRIDNYLDNLGKKIKDKYEEIATLENRIEAINNENRNMVDLSSRLGELVVKLKRIEEELNNG